MVGDIIYLNKVSADGVGRPSASCKKADEPEFTMDLMTILEMFKRIAAFPTFCQMKRDADRVEVTTNYNQDGHCVSLTFRLFNTAERNGGKNV